MNGLLSSFVVCLPTKKTVRPFAHWCQVSAHSVRCGGKTCRIARARTLETHARQNIFSLRSTCPYLEDNSSQQEHACSIGLVSLFKPGIISSLAVIEMSRITHIYGLQQLGFPLILLFRIPPQKKTTTTTTTTTTTKQQQQKNHTKTPPKQNKNKTKQKTNNNQKQQKPPQPPTKKNPKQTNKHPPNNNNKQFELFTKCLHLEGKHKASVSAPCVVSPFPLLLVWFSSIFGSRLSLGQSFFVFCYRS